MTTTTLNPMGLPNVAVADKISNLYGSDKNVYTMHSDLSKMLWELATRKPSWEFTVTKVRGTVAVVAKAHTIEVKENGALLGSIGIDYSGKHNGDAPYIESERISTGRRRGSDRNRRYSKDPKKLINDAIKTFAPKSVAEILEEREAKAMGVVSSAVSDKGYTWRSRMRDIQNEALNYALNEIRVDFLGYLNRDPRKNADALRAMNMIDQAKAEALTANEVDGKLRAGEATLVLVEGDVYTVKLKGEIHRFTSATLPDFLKMPLGMLKLVEDTQMISGIGCRVDSTTFIVICQPPVAEQPQE